MSFRFATRWSLTTLALMAVACTANTASASLQSWGLYNTGVDGSGNILADTVVDSDYALTAAPGGVTTLSASATHAFTSGNPNPGFSWLPNSSTSKWITPTQYSRPASTNPAAAPVGPYDYVLTLNNVPSWLTVSGQWASDNGAKIYLNGSATPSVILAPGGPVPAATSFNTWNAFTLSGFQPGANTILFRVDNASTTGAANPSGLRVEFLSFQVPEATSVAVWGGLSLLGLVARRRRS